MVVHMQKKNQPNYAWPIIACIGSLPPQLHDGKIWHKYEVIITKSYHLAISDKEQQTLSIPWYYYHHQQMAVMMSELKSFTAIMQHLKFTKKFKITKLAYTCTNMPLWWDCHNHTLSYVIKNNHIFCNILVH